MMNNLTQPQNMPWNDFNTAEPQHEYELIPVNTIAPVQMKIKPGGYNDATQYWDGGYATCNPNTRSVYLNCEFVILQGKFAKRKIWQLIGLHSEKSDEWQKMGRSFIRAILNSSNGLSDKDVSLEAQQKRCITHLQELDKRCFVVKIGVRKNDSGDERNEIKAVLSSDHREYQAHAMCFLQPSSTVTHVASASVAAVPATQPIAPQPEASVQTAPVAPSAGLPDKPHWADANANPEA